MNLPTLYKRDSKGRARQWLTDVIDGSTVIVQHGLVDGAQVTQQTKATPKNVGKANETTAEQQAQLEAAAKHRIQIEREDYHEDIEQAGLQFRPMLAQDYLKVPHQVDWSRTVGQAKLDGLRLSYGWRRFNAIDQEFLSRKGITYGLPHLTNAADDLLWEVNASLGSVDGEACPMLDGEVYRHGWLCSKILSRATNLQPDTEELSYYLFDLYIPGMEFEERHAVLTAAMEIVAPKWSGLLKLVLCHPCPSEAVALDRQALYISRGFEGAMLRHIDSEYAVGQRSSDLFKFKVFQDCECKIIDVWPDLNGNAMLSCEFGPDKKRFNCTPKRSHGERKAMLLQKDQLIGSWITVKYQDLTVDGLPSFPVGLELRPCDDAGQPLV
jgi:ATP-dependent DNA ligase